VHANASYRFIMTYVPIYWLIPGCDIMWGVFTLLQYRVNSYAELAAYRFMVGWFEAAFFPAIHYVLVRLRYLNCVRDSMLTVPGLMVQRS
jgi:hypothetical protein